MNGDTITVEHLDPRKGVLVCGLLVESNEILSDHRYNASKGNRFVPYRVKTHPAPANPGDLCEFLIGADIETDTPGEWVVCEFMEQGGVWWVEANRIGCNQVAGGKGANAEKDELGRSVNALKRLKLLHQVKTESGKAALCSEGGKKTHQERDIHGKSEHWKKSLAKAHEVKNDAGKCLAASIGGVNVSSQRVRCLVTGHVSNPGGLTRWQNARGIDTSLRERID